MAKYVSETRVMVNGVDVSSYVCAVEFRMACDKFNTTRVEFVGGRVETTVDDSGRPVVTIHIADDEVK